MNFVLCSFGTEKYVQLTKSISKLASAADETDLNEELFKQPAVTSKDTQLRSNLNLCCKPRDDKCKIFLSSDIFPDNCED